MADETDEYLYRLGLDAREFVDGIEQALSALGAFDDRVTSKMPTKLRALSRQMAGTGEDIRKALGGKYELSVDDKKALAAEARQTGQLQKLQAELKQASDAYARFQRESARGSAVPGGLNLQSPKVSDADLARLQTVQKALAANGVQTASPFNTALNAEVTRRQTAARQEAADSARQIADAKAVEAARVRSEEQAAAAAARATAQRQKADEKAAADAVAAAERTRKANENAALQTARNYESALPRVRYVLYDIANTAALAGTAVLGAGLAIIKVGADYESAYAQVKRTSDILTDPSLNQAQKDDRYADLRKDLVQLSEQIPLTFQDLSQIAKTGNQLGIASTDIANFTEATAKFSAVTGVSTDAAATAFGRLGQILHDTNYKQIGDEIAYLGVKSVATEQDIITTSGKLAAAGQSINLTAKDVLALSTTTAGLGIAPENARGTFIRAFGQISAAIASGGSQLNSLARISGLTKEQFKSDFLAGGDSALNAFYAFTGGLGHSAAEINSNLASVGITATRDKNALSLFAQNGTRAIKDLENATKGSKNNFLDTAFAVQADTVNTKLVTLGNTVKAIFDSIGASTTGPLHVLLDGLQGFLDLAQKLTANPLTSWTLAVLTGLTLLAGAALLGGAALARLFGFIVALNQVQALNVNGQTGLAAVMSIVTGKAEQQAGVLGILSATNDKLAASTLRAAAGQEILATNIGTRTTAPITATTNAASRLTGVLGKAGLIGAGIALVASVPSIVTALSDMANGLTGATIDADKLEKKLESLKGKAAAQNLQDIKNALPGGQGATLGDAIGSGFLNPLGAGDGKGGYQADNGKSFNGTQAAVNQITTGQRTPGTSISFLNGAAQFDKEADTQLAKIQTIDKALTSLYTAGDTAGFKKGLDLYTASMKAQHVSADDAKAALIGLTAAEKQAGDAGNKAGTDTAFFAGQLSDLFDANIQAQTLTSDIAAVGTAVAQSGASVGLTGAAMKTALSDIFASTDNAGVAKGRLQSFYNQLVALGYGAKLLEPVKNAIDSIRETAIAAPVDISAFTNALDTASKTAKTLTDYSSDLQGVLSRSFDLRFGDQEALDKVTAGFQTAKSAIKDARDELKAAKADLAQLNANQSSTEYELGIAQKYGDVESQTRLAAEKLKNDADIAAAKKKVSDDTAKASTALTGNSAGAINNRQQLLGNIQNSQNYVQSLAANGASKAQIEAAIASQKKQFIAQATAAGFSRKEVVKLAKAYDDMNQVVKEVPRDIKTHISSNASPATKALKEYTDALHKADGTKVKTAIDTTITYTTPGLPGLDKGIGTPTYSIPKILTKAQVGAGGSLPSTTKSATSTKTSSSASAVSSLLGAIVDQLFGIHLFREGGYTGNLPPWQVAGQVHGDEFVLNSAAQKMFPRQMLENANAGIAPISTNVTASASIPAGTTMSLGRTERALLAQAANSHVVVHADRVGSAMDQAFSAADRRGSN